MRLVLLVVDALLVFLLHVVFSICGLVPSILISGWIGAISFNYIDSFRYMVAGVETLACTLLIYYAVKHLRRNQKIHLLYDFNALEKDAIISYFQTAIIGFAFGFIFFIPKYLNF